ncbi:MAG: YciI family protein [Mesorhizobium sp.]|uniref:YciI family protein n=1 Tax=unclassified Mesorhizobium TaxID=325217 RepID=UPI0007FD9BA5|nr:MULTISPECIES: YciI family protein [unclassified Mesorhizobium]TGV91054.1 YciI family protein [Mesorhizobium sp. M00.F.Ca.ET.158.01.1.1]WIE93621.1 YciI family protein [Mesorhizobium sp. WSM4875]AZO61412.1 YciI family protein [Mesorhizobium sp. M1A.F.Ca.IN.022.06.1.1]MCT2577169.1 YciI family protein [Mesorhizobium sp. P13.3]MDF3166107.1 YciI family protein [Mesorhizobium sp. P16.1]
MLYAILCYASEDVVCSWSKEQDEEVMAKLLNVQDKYARAGRLGPVARLLPTTAATTLRKVKGESVVLDGPFAETKEQFLGFYTLECNHLDEAVEFARELSEVNPSGGSYEIRPISVFNPTKVPA